MQECKKSQNRMRPEMDFLHRILLVLSTLNMDQILTVRSVTPIAGSGEPLCVREGKQRHIEEEVEGEGKRRRLEKRNGGIWGSRDEGVSSYFIGLFIFVHLSW